MNKDVENLFEDLANGDVEVLSENVTYDPKVVEVVDTFVAKKIPTGNVNVDYTPREQVVEAEATEEEIKNRDITIDDVAKAKRAKKKELKEELKGVNDKYKAEIDVQKKEAAKQDKKIQTLENEKLNNVLVIDAQNTDDRKKVLDFMNEGRLIVDRKFKPFILAPQPADIYQYTKSPIHTIMCEEVIHVTVRKYYLDLAISPVGQRTLSNEYIWCYHNGYHVMDLITKEQLEFLLDNGYLTSDKVLYTFIDKSTGSGYFMGSNNGKEPTIETMKIMSDKDVANFKLQGNVLRTGKDADFREVKTVEVVKEPIPMKDLTEEELVDDAQDVESQTLEENLDIDDELNNLL